MTATTTSPTTVSLRPASLAALLAATAAVSIGATWTTTHVAGRDDAERRPAVATVAPTTQAYIDGIAAMSPAQLAAAYGYNNYPEPDADGITTATP